MRPDIAADNHEHDVVADRKPPLVEPHPDIKDAGQRPRARDRRREPFAVIGELHAPHETPALLAAAQTVTDAELDRFMILARGTRGFNVTDRLDRIRCGVLIIGVYEDAILDSDATMEIAERLDDRPDFRLYIYVGYGHAAYDTAPDYRDRIQRFLMQS